MDTKMLADAVRHSSDLATSTVIALWNAYNAIEEECQKYRGPSLREDELIAAKAALERVLVGNGYS